MRCLSLDDLVLAHFSHDALDGLSGRVVLDCVRAFAPAFQPSEIVRQCAETLSSYGLSAVTGDAYAATWCSDEFRKCGITYMRSAKAKNEIYLETLPLFTSNVITRLLSDNE